MPESSSTTSAETSSITTCRDLSSTRPMVVMATPGSRRHDSVDEYCARWAVAGLRCEFARTSRSSVRRAERRQCVLRSPSSDDECETESAIADGRRVPVFTGTERGHPLFEVQVIIKRGQTMELRFLLTEPTAPGAPRVPIQPLLDPVTPVVSVPECSGDEPSQTANLSFTLTNYISGGRCLSPFWTMPLRSSRPQCAG